LDLITSKYRDKPVIIRGVINGTTNFILTKLHQGISYEDAFAKAKELGLTETDPGEDLLGIDHARKLVILSKLAGKPIGEKDVLIRGMAKQFGNDFEEIVFDKLIKEKKKADESDYLLIDELEKSESRLIPKMIAELDLEKGKGIVKLDLLEEDDPLAKVENELNAVMIKNQEGIVLWKSEAMRGAGGEATANAILRDCVKIASSEKPVEVSMIK